ncbi:MAG: carbohydrate ABC transporter permease [Spirochaetaceae bacterium]|jgi:ABC-type glycerol-3-phosphate transport system permease component|nr:carbohydrate ABC transporter permease [Spirochaetaceae bacterium]
MIQKSPLFYAGQIAKMLFLAFLVFISLFPIYWTGVNSFRTNTQIYSAFSIFPEQLNFEAYLSLFKSKTILTGLMNSAIITGSVMIFSSLIVLMASYTLGVYKFRGGRFIHLAFAAAMFVPGSTTLGTVYKLIADMGLLSTRVGIIILYTSGRLALSIFLMTAFIQTIPLSIEEAAIIDGCNPWSLFSKIVVPLSRNGVMVILILTFIGVWNEYIMAMIMLPSRSLRTLTVALANYFKSEFTTDYAFLSAGVIIGLLPIVTVYLALQERIINGLVASAVKG